MSSTALVAEAHMEIVDAVRSKDLDRAKANLRAHIEGYIGFLDT